MGPDSWIFLSEDVAGGSVHRGWKRRLYAAYAAFLSFATVRTLRSYRPAVAVVPTGSLAAIKNRVDGHTRLVAMNTLAAKALAHADMACLIGFQRALLAELAPRSSGTSAAELEAVANRVVLAGLLEHVARPAEAFGRFFDEEKAARGVILLSGSTPRDRIAREIAVHLGWKVAISPFRIVFAAAQRARRLLIGHGDGLPQAHTLRKSYVSGESTPGETGILFFAVDERRIRRLGPAMKRLAESGTPTTLAVLGVKKESKEAAKELRGGTLRVESINEFLPPDFSEALVGDVEGAALRAWNEVFAHPPATLGARYRGVSLSGHCAREYAESWGKISVEARLFRLCAERYLELRRPKLVFLPDNSLHSMLLARLCQERGIRTVFYVYNPVLFTVDYWQKLLLEAMRPDYVLAANSQMELLYRRDGGMKAENVRIVGDVFASRLTPAEVQAAREKLARRLSLAAGEKVVLALSFFVGPDLSETQKRRYLRCIARGVNALKGARLVVKAHPNEDAALLTRMLEEEGIRPALVAHTESLRELLLASDAAIILFSQAGMEVVQCEVPLLIVQDKALLPDFEAWVPYVSEGAAEFVDEEGDLAQALGPILFDPAVRAQRLASAARFRERFIAPAAIDPVEAMVRELQELYRNA